MLTQPQIWWRVPLLTAVSAVVLDLFIDPVAVAAGYWVWPVPGTVYFGIPLLTFAGWFVLMFLAPLTWITIAQRRQHGYWRKGALALGVLLPFMLTATVLSLLLNSLVAVCGLHQRPAGL